MAWRSAGASARSDTLPIIFVTSREEEFDRVLGLEIGADDYLCKPFSMRELMARVKVLLRRATAADAPVRSHEDQPVICGPLAIDPLRLAVLWDGRQVLLTVTEILLLQGLVRRPGIVKTREQLMLDAYPDRVSVSDRTIDSHVKRIRRKFQAVDPAFDHIEGVRRRLSVSHAVMGRHSWLTRRFSLRPSRIGRRLLAFNLLLVFLPGAGILYLDVMRHGSSRRRSAGWFNRIGPSRAALATPTGS
jgi:DNA-binding response OmpR family regulator